MRRRWGLQAKMTASYVLVTAAVVVLVEVVAAAVVLPGLLSGADRVRPAAAAGRRLPPTRSHRKSATLGRAAIC